MSKENKIENTVKKFKAAEGKCLPIYYLGSIIRIDDNNSVEIDLSKLLHEPKIQLEKAIVQKHISETGE
jgi:hypothetical protein